MIALQILGAWLCSSVIFGVIWSLVRHAQKQREVQFRLAELQMERARRRHIVTEYRRIGAI